MSRTITASPGSGINGVRAGTQALHYLRFMACAIGLTAGFSRQLHGQEVFYENPIAASGSKTFCGTPSGLFEYNAESKSSRFITAADGLAGTYIYDLAVDTDEDILWVAAAGGVSKADVRSLDWQTYTAPDALPHAMTTALAYDEDHVYAGTFAGVARFDKMTEEWETVSDGSSPAAGPVNDLLATDDYLWVATPQGLARFDKNYEKWETLADAAPGTAPCLRLYSLDDQVWVRTRDAFYKYDPDLKAWQSFGGTEGLDMSGYTSVQLAGGKIWAAGPGGADTYDPATQLWSSFTAGLKIKGTALTGFSLAEGIYWFLTAEGLHRYDEGQNAWTLQTTADGILDYTSRTMYASGKDLLIVHPDGISLYDAENDKWHASVYSAAVAAAGPARSSGYKVSWPDKGLTLETPWHTSSVLTGLYTFRLKNEATFSSPVMESMRDYLSSTSYPDTLYNDYLDWYHKADLSLGTSFPGNRRFSAFLDNSELDDPDYGLTYTGAAGDIVRRGAAGKEVLVELPNTELIAPVTFLGSRLQLEAGPATKVKKRRLASLRLAAGKKTTRFIRRFLDYNSSNFYELQSPGELVPGSVQLKIDGEEIPASEYIMERSTGIFFFRDENYIGPDTRIEVLYEYRTEESDETVLSSHAAVSLNDNITVGAAHTFWDAGHDSSGTRTGTLPNRMHTGSFHADLEYKSTAHDAYIRFTPEVAVSGHDSTFVSKQGYAARADLVSRWRGLKLKARHRTYDPQYDALGDWNTYYGLLRQQNRLEGEYAVTDWLPVSFGAWQERSSGGTENKQLAGILLSRASWPAIRLSWNRQQAVTDTLLTYRQVWGADAAYEVPKTVGWINGLKLRASLRTDLQSDSSGSAASFGKNNTGIIGMTVSPVRKLFMDAEIKTITQYLSEPGQAPVTDYHLAGDNLLLFSPYFRYDQALRQFDVSLYSPDLVPGITLYGRTEGDLTTDYTIAPNTAADSSADLFFDRRLTASMTVSPGSWHSVLNPLLLNFGTSYGYTDSLHTTQDRLSTSAMLDSFSTRANTYSRDSRSWRVESVLDLPRDLEYRTRWEQTETENDFHVSGRKRKLYNDLEWSPHPRLNVLGEYDLATERNETNERSAESLSVADTLVWNRTLLLSGQDLTEHTWRGRIMKRFNERFKLEGTFGIRYTADVRQGIGYDTVAAPADTFYSSVDTSFTTRTLAAAPTLLLDYTFTDLFGCREIRIRNTGSFTLNRTVSAKNDPLYTTIYGNRLDLDVKVTRNIQPRCTLNLAYTDAVENSLYYYFLFKLNCMF